MATKTTRLGLNKIEPLDKLREVLLGLFNANWEIIDTLCRDSDLEEHKNDSSVHVTKDGTLQEGLNAEMVGGARLGDLALAGHNHDGSYYTKAEADGRYPLKTDVYTKNEAEGLFAAKSDVYTRDECNTIFAQKEDVYTKEEVNNSFALKADVYTRTEIESMFVIHKYVVVPGEETSTVQLPAEAPPFTVGNNSLDVFVDGVLKEVNTDYTELADGRGVQFVNPIPAGSRVLFKYR